MYQALKGFYLSSTCLKYKERRKPINKFTLTLRLYNVLLYNVI
jgi:hypothetical protein